MSATVDELTVSYSDGGQWDGAADGDGPSLELINPLLPNEYGPSWAASLVSSGLINIFPTDTSAMMA